MSVIQLIVTYLTLAIIKPIKQTELHSLILATATRIMYKISRSLTLIM